jgi:mannose-6-phosphate isomerase-like protein (cupin superfamily)
MANDEILAAKAGSFVWIPRGTVHAFKVESATVTVLNMYTPAGFEQAIITGGTPLKLLLYLPKISSTSTK